MVFHLCSQLDGGAGVAAKRLHLSLLRIGLGSKLFTGRRDSSDEGGETAFDNSNFVWRNFAALRLSWANRITVRDGLFTEPGWIRRTQLQSLSTRPDVVNLHWVSRWLDVPSFLKSLPSLLPVVWSLHDMNPFTGGCHHAGDCDRFTRGCGGCPRLRRPGENDASRRGFLTKQRLYARRNIHFVGNSEWTTNQAKRSGLASSVHSFHTIPLGIDVDKYQPVSKASARDILRIPHGRFVVGFACPDFGDPNKGGTLLVKAVRALAEQHVVTVVAFGAGRLPEIGRGVEVIELGVVKSARLQSAFYSALDVFVSPSRIETFGLTAQEAMACGTPVLAFRTGGLPEVVADGETGLLEEKVGDVCGLVQKLLWFMHHPAERLAMGLAARKRVENHFTDRLFAERYCKLYGELVRIEAC